MKRRKLQLNVWSIPALAVGILAVALWFGIPASAQTAVPDMTQFGFPNVTASATFTPGQAITLTAGTQSVQLPADFISKTVKFEFLEGSPSFFAPNLGTAQGMDIVATFAFRVTDPATGQLLGRFDKPVLWSVTDPRITSDSKVFNSTPANPPTVTANPTPGTVQGNTLSHSFGGAGVGWLVLNPAAATAVATSTAVATAAATAVATAVATSTAAATAPATAVVSVPPTEVPTPISVGMPSTGAGPDSSMPMLLVVLLAGALVVSSGIGLRMRARRKTG